MPSPGQTASSLLGVRPDHVVVVIEENKHLRQVVSGSSETPTISSWAERGALFTSSHGLWHPSQPNYHALFSGSLQGLTDNSCPHTFSADNLGAQLQRNGMSFVGYSQGLPTNNPTMCSSGPYWRKHNPWVNYSNLPASTNQPFTAFPSDLSRLPTVAFVVPDQNNDMHDGSVAQGDRWLAQNLQRYVDWAFTHNSLLILTADEDDGSDPSNHIATVFLGPMVQPGQYSQPINHYDVLRTLEEMYGLPALANAAQATAIRNVWKPAAGDIQRTVIFIEGQTAPGQNMFVRGGIDHAYAATLGRTCTAQNDACSLPIHHRNLHNDTTVRWKLGNDLLNWYGAQSGQGGQASGAQGTALDWTTDTWPSSYGARRTVATHGFGVEPLNTWGPHQWMLDVDMDCSKTVNGWFEVKSYVSGGPGWEADVTQNGAPYPSKNHFARCGMRNHFVRGASTADIAPL